MDAFEKSISTLLASQIDQIWSEGRTDLIDSLYAETVVDHMPVPGQVGGRAGLKQAVDMFRAGLPDLDMTLHGTISCGDIGVDWWTLEGTHSAPLLGVAPTGRKVRFSGIDWVRVRDGRIAELWHIEELFQMAEQLGMSAGPAVVAADDGVPTRMPDLARLTATERRNLAVAQRHIEQLWAAGDLSVAHQVYADDVIDMNPAPGQRAGVAGILDVLGWLRAAAPDLQMRITGYAVEGDHAADRWIMTGTHSGSDLFGLPARGRRFVMQGMDVVRLTPTGLIDRVWHVEDMAALRAQL